MRIHTLLKIKRGKQSAARLTFQIQAILRLNK